ncbi:G-protein coupled receptor C02B8.5 [Biomphalaria glabrata]|nr:G-protein coupled receptor C02B8.5 [Biomphalaria glabrata]
MFNSSEQEVTYFVWPDVSYFPPSGNGEEDIFWRRFEKTMSWIVIPAISFFGIVGNVINIIILIKGQLNKCSNWLILALAVSDTVYLLGANNVCIQLYVLEEPAGFKYSETKARLMYYLFLAQNCIELTGKVNSMMLPCLISLDRLVAIFAPFQYPRIVTLRRARLTIVLFFVISVMIYTFYSLKFTFQYTAVAYIHNVSTHQREETVTGIHGIAYQKEDNVTYINTVSTYQQENTGTNITHIGRIAKSSLYLTYGTFYNTLVKTVIFLYGPLHLCLTVAACISVGVRIKQQEKRRVFLQASFAKIQPTTVYFKTSTNSSPEKVANRKQHKNIEVALISATLAVAIATGRNLDETTSMKETTDNQRLLHSEISILSHYNSESEYISACNDITAQSSPTELSLGTHSPPSELSFRSHGTPTEPSLGTQSSPTDFSLRAHNSVMELSLETDGSPTELSVGTRRSSKELSQRLGKDSNRNPKQNHLVKRRKNKTTRTLLSVCGVYCAANTINFLVLSFSDSGMSTKKSILLETSRRFVLVLNSACNFLFYVGLNQNFRNSYRQLFGQLVSCFSCRDKSLLVTTHRKRDIESSY